MNKHDLQPITSVDLQSVTGGAGGPYEFHSPNPLQSGNAMSGAQFLAKAQDIAKTKGLTVKPDHSQRIDLQYFNRKGQPVGGAVWTPSQGGHVFLF